MRTSMVLAICKTTFLLIILVVHTFSAIASEIEFQLPLIAGQHVPVGTIVVSNTDAELIVNFHSDENWLITESHVDIATAYEGLHTNKKGNPQPGKFHYSAKQAGPVAEIIYRIPLGEWIDRQDFVIATHAVVQSTDNTETAWAGDIAFPGENWATYFMYTLQHAPFPPGILKFSNADLIARESPRGFRLIVPVIREQGNTGIITATYKTADETATAGADYTGVEGVLEFADMETEKTFFIDIINDNVIEGSEVFKLELTGACCIGEPSSATVTIVDDESDN